MTSASASMAGAGLAVTLKTQIMDPVVREMKKVAEEMGSLLAGRKSRTQVMEKTKKVMNKKK